MRTALGIYTLGANLENLQYNGAGGFTGTGNLGSNRITGGKGDDVIDGAAGTDTMIRGLGDDMYFVGRPEDVVIERANEGLDTVRSSASRYTMAAEVENLVLIEGGDNATGNPLNNNMIGNELANILDGGAGRDELTGGFGRDTFLFRRGEANGDKVLDFEGAGSATGDQLRFVGYASGTTLRKKATATDEYEIVLANGTVAETIQIVGVTDLDTVGSTNDCFFG